MESLPIYYLKEMILFHCKRSAKRCEKCANLAKDGPKYTILRATDDKLPVARPVVGVNYQNQRYFIEFEIVKSFETRKKAIEYLKDNNITYLEIE